MKTCFFVFLLCSAAFAPALASAASPSACEGRTRATPCGAAHTYASKVSFANLTLSKIHTVVAPYLALKSRKFKMSEASKNIVPELLPFQVHPAFYSAHRPFPLFPLSSSPALVNKNWTQKSKNWTRVLKFGQPLLYNWTEG